MKIYLLITAALLVSASARATDVQASVSVGVPEFYGRIEIGTAARPTTVSPIPVVVQPAVVAVERPAIYLRVPPGHAKHWSKHCRAYNACGERVFFVEERWYKEVYLPSRPAQHAEPTEGREHGQGHGHGKGHKDG
jgi:hypothetical protein